MINMKKLMKNGKKAVAGLILTMMAVCMVSSVAYADSITWTGSRKKSTKGYYSYTKVSAYDDRGYALNNIKVGAKMEGGSWSYSVGNGTATVNSAISSHAGIAYHSYQINGGEKVTWMQN